MNELISKLASFVKNLIKILIVLLVNHLLWREEKFKHFFNLFR
jgi:hypothetical protein